MADQTNAASSQGGMVQTNDQKVDTSLPQTASDAPISGLEPAEGVSLADQVKGHAKMFAGKAFDNDKEVQQGAARVKGLDEQQTKQQ